MWSYNVPMSELRKDPFTNRWVIISQERGARPSEVRTHETISLEHTYCPFCEGHEDKTPSEIMAIRDDSSQPNEPGWAVRVIPNKFPAMESGEDLKRYGVGMYDAMSGTGAHEVVVEHPHHILNLADFEPDRIEKVLAVFKSRINDLYKDLRFRFVMVFKNHGSTAGATISHAHSQIIALPIVPWTIKVELEAARAHYVRKERCLFCDVIKQEYMTRERIVADNDDFVAFTPFASRFPFEICIMPRKHFSQYNDTPDELFANLATLLKSVLMRLKSALNDPGYNILVQTAPNDASINNEYHWRLQIMPRLTKVAGFEWGTGFYINPTPPEEAATILREQNIAG